MPHFLKSIKSAPTLSGPLAYLTDISNHMLLCIMPLSEAQESLIEAAYDDAIDAVWRGTVERRVAEQYVQYLGSAS